MIRTSTRLIVIAGFLLLAIGCSKSPTEPTINLADQFCGYTSTAEAPAFNDELLIASGAEESAYHDPLVNSSAVHSLLTDPETGSYHLRVVWGRLRYDSTVTASTDWSGSLAVSRGAVVVRRIIRFEDATDNLLPRTDQKTIEWISQTTTHNDGIAVDLLIPPAVPHVDTTIIIVVDTLTNDTTEMIVVDTLAPAPVTVEFTTGPLSRTFSLTEVATLDTIVTLPGGNEVAFTGFKYERDSSCRNGFLAGFWGYDSTGQGVFKGKWLSRRGELAGHVQGHYEIDSTGARVFFGKWIDVDGNFMGLLKGSWQPRGGWGEGGSDNEERRWNGGKFRGAIYDDHAVKIGIVKGNFRSAGKCERSFFQGRWKAGCLENDSEDGDHEGDDDEDDADDDEDDDDDHDDDDDGDDEDDDRGDD